MHSISKLSAICLATACLVAGDLLNDKKCRTLAVDVAIVGGGAGGAYAAVRLKEDYNKSIVLIEKEKELGGHVSGYIDENGVHWEYGVSQFNDYGPARAFFERLGVTPGVPVRYPLTPEFVDFKTGRPVNTSLPPAANVTAAFQKFLEVVAPFEDYFLPGFWNFPPPDQIPADLLLPFRKFVEKYEIQAAVYNAFQVTAFGAGDLDKALTLYVLTAFGPPMIRFFLGQATLFVPASRRNSEVYEKIQARLGDKVLYSSTVTKSERSASGHTLRVEESSKGGCTIVKASKLVLGIEPTEANLKPFGLDKREKEVVDKFNYQVVHVGIVSHPSLPAGKQLVNTPEAAAGGNYLELPKPNFIPRFDHMAPNSTNFRIMVISKEGTTVKDAQQLAQSSLNAMIKAGTLEPAAKKEKLTFKVWSNHGNMHAHVSADDLRKGFIQKLNGLQGYRGTWWTGGAFSGQLQAILWAFDDILLSKMYP
ncbi:hypothetical protein B0T16DRAFT_387761 [Cercophora newfieldiana]|uniref:Amine oxidase domain-containing protein n=1 Tax=Cercophora newfieldiana TaxID=92897 RepID=A0AA39YHQ5_9PEZI|nr:hypothetical protein B0T16DRAFT_387761 [Cercophora newfieldiana]